MKEISLTQGKVALVDDEDYDRVSPFKWCALKQKYTFYAVRATPRDENGKQVLIYMHNFLLDGRADHADGNGLDNQRSNISLSTHPQNQQSFQTKRAGCSSRYRGVCWHKRQKKWQASIGLTPGKDKHIGYFELEAEAARAYDVAALARDPKFHHLNFPVCHI